jgi:hypothetical protein
MVGITRLCDVDHLSAFKGRESAMEVGGIGSVRKAKDAHPVKDTRLESTRCTECIAGLSPKIFGIQLGE